ncbi:hypothetical protein EV360DRAFT_76289 [Lentinula raphanica]|nr:hypothetical protein EV360DRAFT_76289 [Lentinula raphanica]
MFISLSEILPTLIVEQWWRRKFSYQNTIRVSNNREGMSGGRGCEEEEEKGKEEEEDDVDNPDDEEGNAFDIDVDIGESLHSPPTTPSSEETSRLYPPTPLGSSFPLLHRYDGGSQTVIPHWASSASARASRASRASSAPFPSVSPCAPGTGDDEDEVAEDEEDEVEGVIAGLKVGTVSKLIQSRSSRLKTGATPWVILDVLGDDEGEGEGGGGEVTVVTSAAAEERVGGSRAKRQQWRRRQSMKPKSPSRESADTDTVGDHDDQGGGGEVTAVTAVTAVAADERVRGSRANRQQWRRRRRSMKPTRWTFLNLRRLELVRSTLAVIEVEVNQVKVKAEVKVEVTSVTSRRRPVPRGSSGGVGVGVRRKVDITCFAYAVVVQSSFVSRSLFSFSPVSAFSSPKTKVDEGRGGDAGR